MYKCRDMTMCTVFMPVLISMLGLCIGQTIPTSRNIPTSRTIPRSSSTTRSPTRVWYKEDIPNPVTDIWLCGHDGHSSRVCDPDHVLTKAEADSIDGMIGDIRRNTGGCRCPDPDRCPRDPQYGSYQPAVAVLNKINIGISPSRDEKMRIADSYADYLREDSWELGVCDDDIIILVSKTDRVVYTKTGDNVSPVLTDACVDLVFSRHKQTFSDGDYGRGLYGLLEDYKRVLRGEDNCSTNIDVSWITWVVIGAFGVFIGSVIVVICHRKGKCKRCRGGSHGASGYTTPRNDDFHIHHHDLDHHHDHHSSHHSVSSASSGGGGGEF